MRKASAVTLFLLLSLLLAILLITGVLEFMSASLIFAVALMILGISSHGFTRAG